MLLHDVRQLRERPDVVKRVRSSRDSRPLYLHRRNAQPVPGCDLRVRIIADHQHLTRLECVFAQDLLKDVLLAFSSGLIDRVDVDPLEEGAIWSARTLLFWSRLNPDVTRNSFAGSSRIAPRSGYPCIGTFTSARAFSAQPAASISSEKPYFFATVSSECPQHSSKARASVSSERVP